MNVKILRFYFRIEITNIQLAVQNMFYQSKKMADTRKLAPFEKQLGLIAEHIEDLTEVNDRVRYSDKEEYYKDALPSDKSSIRLDF